MALFLNRIVSMAARRIILDPRARQAVAETARGVAGQVRTIAADEDPARAAGRSLRRALKALRSAREGS